MANSTKTIDWETLVAEAESDHGESQQHDAYQFSKKTFKEDDNAGVYANE